MSERKPRGNIITTEGSETAPTIPCEHDWYEVSSSEETVLFRCRKCGEQVREELPR